VSGPGQPGELLIGGVQVMREYLGDPERTRQNLLTEGGVTYYRTGDVVFSDAKGDYYMTGRKDDTIKRRGYRVNLLDIDSYIQKSDCVSDCVTVAIPDAATDNVLVTFVILSEPTSESSLRQTISRVLVDYQMPDYIEFRTGFPTNNSGKVCRETLAKQFLAGTRRQAG
jgi:acyl-CoA synthetase (AMP-forming)/AMP-acid ligase II